MEAIDSTHLVHWIHLAVFVVFVVAMYVQKKKYPAREDETPLLLLVFPDSYYEDYLEPGETVVFQAPVRCLPSLLSLLLWGSSGKNREGNAGQLAYTSLGALLVCDRGELMETLGAIKRYEHVHIEHYKPYPWIGRPIPGQEPPYGKLTLILDGKRRTFAFVPEPFLRALRKALGE